MSLAKGMKYASFPLNTPKDVMSYEAVDVYVKNQFGDGITGVIVKVFSPSGGVFYTQQITDDDGRAGFLLSTQQYSMRFFKFNATFSMPQLFTVLEAPASNVFDVVGETFVLPTASDARLCRCTGFFRNPDGSPRSFLDMHFYPEFSPIVLEGSAVTPKKMAIRTDEQGRAQIDLIRGGCYRVTLEGLDHEERFVRVPDLAGTNLSNVLYAVVDRVSFDPPGPWTLAAGTELEVTPTVYDSAGVTLHGTGQNDVDWSISDTNLGSVSVGEFKLTLRASSVGSLELRAVRNDQSIIRIPNAAVEGQPVPITIT